MDASGMHTRIMRLPLNLHADYIIGRFAFRDMQCADTKYCLWLSYYMEQSTVTPNESV